MSYIVHHSLTLLEESQGDGLDKSTKDRDFVGGNRNATLKILEKYIHAHLPRNTTQFYEHLSAAPSHAPYRFRHSGWRDEVVLVMPLFVYSAQIRTLLSRSIG